MDFPDFNELTEEAIQFHAEEIDFELPNSDAIIHWVKATIAAEGYQLNRLNFIFCNDTYLHQINLTFLDHDTLTDIITFPYHHKGEAIESDLYISIDRIRENAAKFEVSFLTELKRVIIHGVLHLCGYGDKTKQEKQIMRARENFYLTNNQ